MSESETHSSSEDTQRADVPPAPGRKMTEAEFFGWYKDNPRAEWVNGHVITLPPMGLRQLQIFGLVHGILKGTVTYRDVGHVLAMPFQMRLKHRPSRRSPALMFVATEHLDAIRTYELEGPADLVVEIVAAGAESRYWDEKCQEYAGAGVRELWRIDPAAQDVEAYALSSEGRFRAMPEMDGKIESTILRGFFVKPQWLSRESLPMITEALREMGVTL